jgi:PAP2 superfamily
MPDRPRFQAPERGASAPAWRGAAACLLVTVVALVTALIATNAAGVPLRDPKHVTEGRLTTALLLVAVLIAVDALVRGRDRWPRARLAMTGGVVIAFYATYFAYRNLKSIVPLLRDELFDRRLGDIDRSVFAGRDPAQVLHDLLGTGLSAEVLSVVYGLFFVFVPVSVALALVVPRDPRPGLFFVTALSLNWVLAAGSYFLLPSLGPVYAQPENFADLPSTGVSHLQTALLNQRTEFLHDPAAAGAAQSIGAFASLHVSIFFTAALATLLLGVPRLVSAVVWALLALTVLATLYFGWHYVLDDVAGMAIAVTSLALARALTGFELRTARRRVPAPQPSPA